MSSSDHPSVKSSANEKRKDLPTTGVAVDKKTTVAPLNIFSNDGSFVERFRQMQTEQDEKRKRQDAIEKKKQWEASFRQRGKRKKQADAEDSKNKAAKTQEDLDATASAYLREMRKMKEQLPDGDSGSGVRPLVK